MLVRRRVARWAWRTRRGHRRHYVAQGHGEIAIPEAPILPLRGTSYGLNPNMPWLASQWAAAGNVGFVAGSGENVVNDHGGVPATMERAASKNITDAFEAQSQVFAAANSAWDSSFGSSPVGHQPAQVAMMIEAGIPCQTYVVTLTGFDTHGNESDMQSPLLSQIDTALQDFFGVINAGPRANDVFVQLTSEFGRQQTANASEGCDHGQAGTHIIVGGGMKGGLRPGPADGAGQPSRRRPRADGRLPLRIRHHPQPAVGHTTTSGEVLLQPFEDRGCFE